MGKIKAFFYIFYKSLTSVNYYNDIVKTPAIFSVKYLLGLAVFVSAITAALGVYEITPKINSQIARGIEETVQAYPENLEVNIKEGILSTNLTEPLLVPVPEDSRTENVENILILDTDGTVDDLINQKSLILINSTHVLSRGETDRVESYPLEGMPDTTITRTSLEERLRSLAQLAKYLPIVLFILTFLAIMFYNFVLRLVYLLVPALILMFIGKARGQNLNYSDYYQVALHALTLPIVIEVILAIAGFSLPIVFWFFAANLILGIIVVMSFSKENGQPPQIPAQNNQV